MTYEAPFIRLTFGGTTYSGSEIWSCKLNLGTPGTGVLTQDWNDLTGTEMDAVRAAIGTFISTGTSYVSNKVKLEWVKFAYVDVAGDYITSPKEIVGLDINGGSTVATAPQLALSITGVSEKFKDPGKYTRFFIPTVGTTEATGRFTTAQQDSIGANAVTLINGINSALERPLGAPIAEVCAISSRGTGHCNPVTNVRIGRVIDTQRRRRNSLDEDYKVFPLS